MEGRPNWNDTSHAFTWDGSWRDIYVLGTGAADWNCLPEAFRKARYALAYHVNGEAGAMPQDLSAIIASSGARHYLALGLAPGLTIDCHFFTADEIEFSLDPREVRSERRFTLLLSFMELLGTTVSKPVLLTPENASACALLTFDPHAGSWTRAQAAAGGAR